MSQPTWKLIGQLGDVNPIDHGGILVYQDTTGVYAPEAVVIEPIDSDDGADPERWIVHRFPLERCTYSGGILSDNEYHPDHPAWFAKDLAYVADFYGAEPQDLIRQLGSDDPMDRADAYEAIGRYHGFIELDSEPVTDLDRSEIEARYGVKARA